MGNIITPSMAQLADRLKRHAETGLFRGLQSEMRYPYYNRSRAIHDKTGTSLMFTRDIGAHSSGWFKNPDYELCYHLSVAFHNRDEQHPGHWSPAAFSTYLAQTWCRAFYGTWTRYVWEETNKTHTTPNPDIGLTPELAAANKELEIHHYRVFCDPAWRPIIPRGEVYTREFIEKGWKSFSEQQSEKNQP